MLQQSKTEPTAPTNSSAHVAQRGNSFLSKQETPVQWIVDSGASNPMTGSANLFSSYKKCDGDIRITVADGSSSLVLTWSKFEICSLCS